MGGCGGDGDAVNQEYVPFAVGAGGGDGAASSWRAAARTGSIVLLMWQSSWGG